LYSGNFLDFFYSGNFLDFLYSGNFDELSISKVDPNIGFAELPEEYFTGVGESEAWKSSKGVIQVVIYKSVSK